ncbi:MAG: LptA/OstA family protein, partial [Beijerinckiaceae bacterium]
STAGLDSFGGGDKQPINIEADKLDVFQKDGRAVYAGNVIAVRGDTTIKCSQLTVFFDQTRINAAQGGQQATPATAPRSAGNQGDALKKLDCNGPVSVVTKSDGKNQVVTGKNAVFNRVTNIVSITGDVTLADGPNVTKCESFTYNTDSKIANCVPIAGGRVRGVFEPGDDNGKAKPKPRT